MAGCDDLEIAIEKRLHGALDEAGRPPLEEHLALCERCRRYEAAAREADDAMTASASQAAAQVDWERLERGSRGGAPGPARSLAAAAAAGVYVILAAWISAAPGRGGERVLRLLPSAGIVMALAALVVARSGRRTVSHVDRATALEVYRQVVVADLQWATRMQWALAALLAFFLYRAFAGAPSTYDPLVFYGALSLPLVGLWVLLRRVKVPRAAREARDLGFGTAEGR